MHIKVDEDLPAQATQRLRAEGYDASSVVEQKMGGWKDPQIWQAVQAQRQFLVTADKGFGDIRLYPPQTHGVCCCCGLMKMASGLSSTCWTKCWQHTG